MIPDPNDIMNFYPVINAPVQTVDLTSIRDSPGRFCMSFGFDLNPLVSSIEKVGLINPPLVRRDQEEIEIVTGYRRIMALKALNRATVPCRMVDEERFGPLQCLILNLHDNLCTRKLNDVEKGMVLSRISPWVPRQEIVGRYLPLLELRPDEKNLFFFLEVERDGDTGTKRFIAKEGVTWPVVNILSDMDAPARVSLLRGISYLKFNINQQLQFIDYIVDISYIEGTSIPCIVSQVGIAGIPSKTPNRPQQAKTVLSYLKTRRYPTIMKTEKRFQKTVSDLNLPDGIRIAPPPFFEGDQYRLQIAFREGEELMSKLKQLNNIKSIARIKNPWDEISE